MLSFEKPCLIHRNITPALKLLQKNYRQGDKNTHVESKNARSACTDAFICVSRCRVPLKATAFLHWSNRNKIHSPLSQQIKTKQQMCHTHCMISNYFY